MKAKLKKTIKEFQRACARYGLYFSYWLFEHLSYRTVNIIMNGFMAIGFRFIGRQKWIARDSLRIAFGDEKSPEEIDQIVHDCFRNFGQGMVEMLYCLAHPKMVKDKVVFQGQEHLDKALAKGKGVVAVTAHFGNFPLMMMATEQKGYSVSSIIRPARDKKLEKFLLRKRVEAGLRTIYALPRQQCVQDSIKVLRGNEILFVPLDQNFGSGGGVFVEFFGQQAATATGPVVFALRTGAAILPMFIVRQDDGRHRIIIEPEMELIKHEDEKEMIRFNISRITQLIEQYIRRYPQEWGWMHRRWKSKPASWPRD